jgi:hypothetical protein
MRFGSFENGTAAGFLGEQDLCDIEEWIDPRDLMDFLADEMDGLGIWRDGGSDTFCRWRFFLARRSIAAILEVATAALERAAFATVA